MRTNGFPFGLSLYAIEFPVTRVSRECGIPLIPSDAETAPARTTRESVSPACSLSAAVPRAVLTFCRNACSFRRNAFSRRETWRMMSPARATAIRPTTGRIFRSFIVMGVIYILSQTFACGRVQR